MKKVLGAVLAVFLAARAYAAPTAVLNKAVSSTAVALTEIIAAPPAGTSIYVTGWVCTASVASTTNADQQCSLKYGTGTNCATGTTLFLIASNVIMGGPVVQFTFPIKVPDGNALCFHHNAAGTKWINVQYYIAPSNG